MEIKSKIKIESGIPIPDKYSRSKTQVESYLKKMKVGDSFVVKGWVDMNVIYRAARQEELAVTARRIGNDNFRVWRIRKNGE